MRGTTWMTYKLLKDGMEELRENEHERNIHNTNQSSKKRKRNGRSIQAMQCNAAELDTGKHGGSSR